MKVAWEAKGVLSDDKRDQHWTQFCVKSLGLGYTEVVLGRMSGLVIIVSRGYVPFRDGRLEL